MRRGGCIPVPEGFVDDSLLVIGVGINCDSQDAALGTPSTGQRKLTAQDRVLFFFAGHGATRTLGDEQRGYLVAYDGTDSFASLLPMSHVRDLSSAMAMAKHQLFILDACFGGLLAMRGSTVDPRTPNYVDEITKRRARQVLTAGGANQRVVDSGPGGHSLFTDQLLKALTGGLGDANGDGYIFSELSSYIQVAASQYNQTPGVTELYGHEQGDFVFVNTARKTPSSGGTDSQVVSPGAFLAPEKDVYELLKVGKQSFARGDYASARTAFREAAEIGNAEAMVFLGKMYWSGLGETADHGKAREWLQRAADRGDARAMASLANLYLHPGPYQNPAEAQRVTGSAPGNSGTAPCRPIRPCRRRGGTSGLPRESTRGRHT
jgi:hypothetical protein